MAHAWLCVLKAESSVQMGDLLDAINHGGIESTEKKTRATGSCL